MPFFSRLRKSSKPKAVSGCQDRCCYENAGYAAPSVTETFPSKNRSTRNGIQSQNSDKRLSSRPILHRGDTFTMKDGPPDDDLPEHIKCRTYTKKKNEPPIKTDVFEAMYTRRPIKVAPANTPMRSIPIAFSSNLKTAPRPIGIKSTKARPHSLYAPVSKPNTNNVITALSQPRPTTLRSPQPNRRSQPQALAKPREYLYGTGDRPATKENVQNNKENEDRFKTITLKDVRRSFREKYLNNEKAEERKHQPIWFVDVKGNGDCMQPPTNIANRRSQTRSIHDDDRASFDRETFVGERSRSNSCRSNASVQLQPSPSPVMEYERSFDDQEVLARSSSIGNNGLVYGTFKKSDPRFARDSCENEYEHNLYLDDNLYGQGHWIDQFNSKNQNEAFSNSGTFVKTSADRQKTASAIRNHSDRSSIENLQYTSESVDQVAEPLSKPRSTVARKNTFKVVRDNTDNTTYERPTPGSSSLKRRDTFVVTDPQPLKPVVDPQRGYYLNRYRRLIEQDQTPDPPSPIVERPPKVVPIGIATPFNSRNDREEPNQSIRESTDNRSRFAASHRTMRDEPNVRDESPPLYESTTYLRPRKSPERQSPIRRPSPEHKRPVSPPRRKSPDSRSPTSQTKRPFLSRASLSNISDTLKKPIESVKISFESLRKPASPPRDPSQTNLGFDRFYDPNYYVPKNQNLFGPLATAHLRQVNVSVQPKKVHDPSSRSTWLYNK